MDGGVEEAEGKPDEPDEDHEDLIGFVVFFIQFNILFYMIVGVIRRARWFRLVQCGCVGREVLRGRATS